jgi:hypothetical protein
MIRDLLNYYKNFYINQIINSPIVESKNDNIPLITKEIEPALNVFSDNLTFEIINESVNIILSLENNYNQVKVEEEQEEQEEEGERDESEDDDPDDWIQKEEAAINKIIFYNQNQMKINKNNEAIPNIEQKNWKTIRRHSFNTVDCARYINRSTVIGIDNSINEIHNEKQNDSYLFHQYNMITLKRFIKTDNSTDNTNRMDRIKHKQKQKRTRQVSEDNSNHHRRKATLEITAETLSIEDDCETMGFIENLIDTAYDEAIQETVETVSIIESNLINDLNDHLFKESFEEYFRIIQCNQVNH